MVIITVRWWSYEIQRKNVKSKKQNLSFEEIATFSEDEVYNQKDAEGFINLFGLPIKVKAMLEEKREQK